MDQLSLRTRAGVFVTALLLAYSIIFPHSVPSAQARTPSRRQMLLARPPLLRGLIAYYGFERSSFLFYDDGPNGLTLTNTNTATQGAGKVGGCGAFNFASLQYGTIADSAIWTPQDRDLTVFCWVNLANKLTEEKIVSKGTNFTAATLSWCLEYNFTADKFRWNVSNGTTNIIASNTILNGTGSPTTGVWYPIECQLDRNPIQPRVRIGISALNRTGTYMTAGTWSGTLNDEAGPFQVGAENGLLGLTGSVDELIVLSRLETDWERNFLINSGAGRSWTEVSTYNLAMMQADQEAQRLVSAGRPLPVTLLARLPRISVSQRGAAHFHATTCSRYIVTDYGVWVKPITVLEARR